VSLFQSNLRKQIRNLPKILNFVKKIHYFSKLFTSLLTRNAAADPGKVTLQCGKSEKCCLVSTAGQSCFFESFFQRSDIPIHLPCGTVMCEPLSGASNLSVTGSFSVHASPHSCGCLPTTAAFCREGDLAAVSAAESPVWLLRGGISLKLLRHKHFFLWRAYRRAFWEKFLGQELRRRVYRSVGKRVDTQFKSRGRFQPY